MTLKGNNVGEQRFRPKEFKARPAWETGSKRKLRPLGGKGHISMKPTTVLMLPPRREDLLCWRAPSATLRDSLSGSLEATCESHTVRGDDVTSHQRVALAQQRQERFLAIETGSRDPCPRELQQCCCRAPVVRDVE